MATCKRCNSHGIFTKVDTEGLCQSCAYAYYKELENKTKELEDNINKLEMKIPKEIKELEYKIQEKLKVEADIESLKLQKAEQQSKVDLLYATVQSLKNQIVELDEILMLEEFSLYKPKYDFTSVETFNGVLNVLRSKQKALIKEGNAAKCSTEWTVDGSKVKGKKLTKDNLQLCLRSFNNECEAAILAVKFNNYDKCLLRINKAFDTINKISESSRIYISNEYKKLRIEELNIALEYKKFKEEEKERLRDARDQAREELRVKKEIEEARASSLKEQKHYQNALDKLNNQLTTADESEKDFIKERISEISLHLDKVNDELKTIDYREANQKAGYVYVISNIGVFGSGVYKIGMTRRLDPLDRIYELGDASVPFGFDVHAMIFSDDAPSLEAALHKAFEKDRLNLVNRRREFFRTSLQDIKRVIYENHDKTVEFFDEPEAKDYRESELIRNAFYK